MDMHIWGTYFTLSPWSHSRGPDHTPVEMAASLVPIGKDQCLMRADGDPLVLFCRLACWRLEICK